MQTESKRIILIEDDPLSCMLISNLLMNSGHVISGVATNGSDGLDLIKTVSADISIIDLGLPDVSGIELIRTILKQYSMPVIVLSGNESSDSVRGAGEAGAMSYLVKPVNSRELDRAIIVASIRFRHQIELKTINSQLETEINERKAAQEQILESEFKYRELFETSRDGIAVLDFNDTVVQCNHAFAEICGYSSSDQLCGKSHFDFMLHEYRPLYCKHRDEQVLKRGWSDEYELQYTKNNGSTIFVNSRVWLTRNRSGEPCGMWLFVRDISRLKAAEEQILQYEKMEAIGQLAGGVAHDFNNQLGGIIGYADLLKEMLTGKEQVLNYVNKILSGAHRAADLTTKLLAFARKGKYELVRLDMHTIITDVIELLERTIDRAISIKKIFKAENFFIDGDPTQLHNAILNLSINARDAMPGGGILSFETMSITLSMNDIVAHYHTLSPGSYLKVIVRDNGCGIDENLQKRIFEPFFTTKKPGKGTGLGLAAVYGTIKNHFGSILVESEKNKGTSFEILLPLSKELPLSSAPTQEISTDYKGNGSILLIDDDDLVREMTSEMLKKIGYDVICCKSGIEGIEVYREKQSQVDLIIMDMIMPQLNGYETFLRIRDINSDVKALISSGYSVELHSQRLLSEGAAGLIQKPFTIAELSTKIREILQIDSHAN